MMPDSGINKLHISRPGETRAPGKHVCFPVTSEKGNIKPAAADFARVLEQQRVRTEEINFSAHARQRLQDRCIDLDAEEMSKLARAVDKAAEKGCRSSLLLYRDMAFVAGVANRTIITALDGQNMKEHVFTNIDSALIVE
ncbi:MAG: TIGR02530 family flagellar biosynthesis protein [Bacillota bacterium]